MDDASRSQWESDSLPTLRSSETLRQNPETTPPYESLVELNREILENERKFDRKYYSVYYNTQKIYELTRDEFNKYKCFKDYFIHVRKSKYYIVFGTPKGKRNIVRRNLDKTQGLFADLLDFPAALRNLLSVVTAASKALDSCKQAIDIVKDNATLILVNILKVLSDALVMFNSFSVVSLGNLLFSFYTCFVNIDKGVSKITQEQYDNVRMRADHYETRWNDLVLQPLRRFRAQSLDALFVSALSLMMPAKVFEVFKRISVFTHLKILDDMHVVDNLIEYIFTFIKTVLSFFGFDSLLGYVESIFSFLPFGKRMLLVRRMREQMVMIEKIPNMIAKEDFRENVLKLNKEMEACDSFTEWTKRSVTVQRIVSQHSRLCKNVKSYEKAVRVEPNCFVFEGPPGSKKSTIVGKLCQLLSKKPGLSVYSHLIKSVSDGKDWYDSYNNEDIFLMDDIGQQGVSQWRTLINMVSPLRLPLECAESKLKDTKFFSSNTIFVTTNNFSELHNFSKNDCISEPEALWRRGYVFDFSDVRMDPSTGELIGRISFKYYDWLSKKWIYGFPPYFAKGLPTFIGKEKTVLDELRVLAWMKMIVTTFLEHKAKFNTSQNLTNSQVSIIDQYEEEMLENMSFAEAEGFFSDVYVKTKEYAEIVKESANSLMSYVSDLVVENVFNISNDTKDAMYNAAAKVGIISISAAVVYSVIGWFLNKDEISQSQAKYEKLKSMIRDPDSNTHPNIPVLMKNVKDVKIKTKYGIFESSCIVSGHHVIVPAHNAMDQEVTIQIIQDGEKNIVLMDYIPATRVYYNKKGDVAIYRLPNKNFTPFRNISHMFTFENKRNFASIITAAGMVPLKDIFVSRRDAIVYENGLTGVLEYVNVMLPNEYVAYKLSIPTLCGSPIVNGTSIAGFHVAGNENNGSAILWNEKTLDEIRFLLEQDKFILNLDYSSAKLAENTTGVKVDYKFLETTPKSSSFIPTKICGVYPVDREPANMLLNGPHTVKDMMKKNMIPNAPADLELFKEATEIMDIVLNDFEPLTEEQVVKGMENLAKVNSKSSNGMFFEGEKKDWIDFENGKYKDNLKDRLEEISADIKKGIIHPDLLFVKSTLKDELRDKRKGGKPRAFQILPLSLQVLTKKYFGGMVSHLVKTRDFHGISIGINPYKEWKKLYNEAKAAAISMSLDFPDWDGMMLTLAQSLVCDKIMEKFKGTPQEKLEAEIILRTLIHKIIVCNDDAYLFFHGMPSGSFLTAVFNSLINLVYTVAWYIASTGKKARTFYEDVMPRIYGDDNMVHVLKKSLISQLNALSLRDFLSTIGIKCTTADKRPVERVSENLEELQFLKRKFVFHPEINSVVGALDLTTLKSGLNFYDSASDDDEDKILRDKLNCFQRELFLHGRETFEEEMKRVREYCNVKNFFFKELSYSYLLNLYRIDDDSFAEPMIHKYLLL